MQHSMSQSYSKPSMGPGAQGDCTETLPQWAPAFQISSTQKLSSHLKNLWETWSKSELIEMSSLNIHSIIKVLLLDQGQWSEHEVRMRAAATAGVRYLHLPADRQTRQTCCYDQSLLQSCTQHTQSADTFCTSPPSSSGALWGDRTLYFTWSGFVHKHPLLSKSTWRQAEFLEFLFPSCSQFSWHTQVWPLH